VTAADEEWRTGTRTAGGHDDQRARRTADGHGDQRARRTAGVPTGANSTRPKAVEPTWVILRPGATAVSAVTISLPPMLHGCAAPRWKVTAPVPRARANRVPNGPRMICDYTSIVVSPLYPRRVPITQNYPASARPTSARPTSPNPSAS